MRSGDKKGMALRLAKRRLCAVKTAMLSFPDSGIVGTIRVAATGAQAYGVMRRWIVETCQRFSRE